MLTATERDTFEQTGVFKIEGAFSDDEAALMCAVVWRELARKYGIEEHDRSTWYRHEPNRLTATKRHSAFAPIFGPPVTAVLDELLGERRWQRSKHYGQVLVTMPNAAEWRVPHRIWHSDFPPTLPRDRLTALKLWVLFDDVEPGGAGTPQLEGSHTLFARYVTRTRETDYKRAKFGFLASHPWLQHLTHDDGEPERNATFLNGNEIDGVTVRVIECTGRTGDVYVTHPWVFHSIAPNATPRPRLMRSLAVHHPWF